MKEFIKIPEKRRNLLRKDGEIEKLLEKLIDVKIKVNDEISIEGESFNIFQGKQILMAFGRGFEVDDCLNLLDDGYGLEVIDLSEVIKSKNRMAVIKGRIIGTRGKTKKYIERFTKAKIAVLGKTVSIIGEWDNLNKAKRAINMLLEGCSHQTLYRWLEQQSTGV